MTTEMMPPVSCQHRWRSGPTYPYPKMPVLAYAGDEDASEWGELDIAIETGVCKRCGGARMRLFSQKREHFFSGWSHAESMAELVLGRSLNQTEEERVLEKIGLN